MAGRHFVSKCALILSGMYHVMAISAEIDSNITLDCSASAFDYPMWIGPTESNPHIAFSFGGYSSFKSIGEKKSRLSWASDNKSLVVKDLKRYDEGTYRCYDSAEVTMLNLQIRVPPQHPLVAETSTFNGIFRITATPGNRTTLVCTSRGGYPEPTVEWKVSVGDPEASIQVDPQLEPTNETYTVTASYTFTPTIEDDLKDYTCQSSYSTLPTLIKSVTVRLYLNLKPSQPALTQIEVPVEGQENIRIARCDVKGFRPKDGTHLTWWFGNVPQTSSEEAVEDGTTYKISDTYRYTGVIERQDNGRRLDCLVTHPTLSAPLNDSLAITVHFPPLSATLSGKTDVRVDGLDMVSLVCTAGTAIPGMTTIIWTRNGEPMISGLPLNYTQGAYSGTVVSQTLEFVPSRAMDGQEIRCRVANSVNALNPVISSSKRLNLKYQPAVVITNGPIVSLTEGESVTLTCRVTSKPTANITWTGIRGELVATDASNSQLDYTLHNTDLSTAGIYKCSASNGIGDIVTAVVDIKIKCAIKPDSSTTSAIVGGVIGFGIAGVLMMISLFTTSRWYTCIRKPGADVPSTAENIRLDAIELGKDLRSASVYDELKHTEESGRPYDSLQYSGNREDVDNHSPHVDDNDASRAQCYVNTVIA